MTDGPVPDAAAAPVRANRDALTEWYDDGAIVLDLVTFDYIELDRVGAAMWRALLDTTTKDEAVDVLSSQFDAERGVLARDLAAFVGKLAGVGLMQAAPAEPDAQEPAPALVARPAEELYLDLLVRSLTGATAHVGGASLADGSHLGTRASGLDFSAVGGRQDASGPLTMIGLRRLSHLRDLAVRAIEDGVPGDFVETGVWRGGASILLAGVLSAYGVTDRRVWLADTFAGLPEPDLASHPIDGSLAVLAGQLAVPLGDVQDNVRRYGLLDDRVRFLPGLFADTLPGAPIERVAVLRLDGDYYGSTWDALDALYPRVSPGGYVVVDDWALEPCRAAVVDYRAAHSISAPVEPIDWCGAFWQVPQA